MVRVLTIDIESFFGCHKEMAIERHCNEGQTIILNQHTAKDYEKKLLCTEYIVYSGERNIEYFILFRRKT